MRTEEFSIWMVVYHLLWSDDHLASHGLPIIINGIALTVPNNGHYGI